MIRTQSVNLSLKDRDKMFFFIKTNLRGYTNISVISHLDNQILITMLTYLFTCFVFVYRLEDVDNLKVGL